MMNFDQSIEPLRLVLLAEIEQPLSLTDILESITLAKELHNSMAIHTDKDVDLCTHIFATALHSHFDIPDNGVISNLQLRGLVATMRNVWTRMLTDNSVDDTTYADIIEVIPHLFYEGFEDDRTAVDKQQLRLRLAGIAPTYSLQVMPLYGSRNIER